MRKIWFRYRELMMYGIFGVLTTGVNMVSYGVLYSFMSINNMSSTIIAWILSVLFAYVTNKLWVFSSFEKNVKMLLYELCMFVLCRLLTGVIDVGIMVLTVDIMEMNALGMKLVANIIVIILNYLASKRVVFNRKIAN